MKLTTRQLQTINDALVLVTEQLRDNKRRAQKADLDCLVKPYQLAGEQITEALRAIHSEAKVSGIKLKDFDHFGLK